jgi:CBS domain-containing protein
VGDLVERARAYATGAHARINQLRKYTSQPYDVHLKSVAELVASVSDDEAMIAAAWLHDTVEDTPATFEDIEREFGPDVMCLVKELTDVSTPGDGNRAARKAIDLRHSAGASARAKTIKLADIVDNCEDICRHDAKFGRVYVVEAEALLGVLTEGHGKLHALAAEVISRCRAGLGRVAAGVVDQEVSPDAWGSNPAVGSGRHGMRLFMEAFAARDIREPLPSFDASTVDRLPPGEWPWPDLPIAGVREEGATTGYLLREDAAAGRPLRVRAIDRRQLVALDAPLTDVIHVLTHFAHGFVELDGAVVGVVGRGDIEKPVVRMWLFGIIILVEVQVIGLIRARWPDGSWAAGVSAGRLEKARQLQAERARRGLPADLLDCLQLSDKLQIALQDRAFVEASGFGSLSAAKKVMKDLESLRNNLAHGQDVTSHDWPQIVRLARRIQQMYAHREG